MTEKQREPDWYALGIDPTEVKRGYALFTGSEGEDPTFRAFFLDEEAALACAGVEVPCGDREGDADPLFFDPCVVLAVVVGGVVYAANDFTIATHDELEARVARALAYRGGTPCP